MQAGSPCEAHSVPSVGGQFQRPGPGQNVLRQRTGSGEDPKPDSLVSARGLGLGWEQNRDLELRSSNFGGFAILNIRRVLFRCCSPRKEYR